MGERVFNESGVHQAVTDTRSLGDLRYTLSLPSDFDLEKGPYPLVVALHYGFDRAAPFPPFYGRGILDGLFGPALGELNAIILAPDSQGGSWTDTATATAVLELTDMISTNYPVDRERNLLAGFSLGGLGTWHILGISDGRFHAGLSVAAAPTETMVQEFPNLPLYVIHSSDDEVFPVEKLKHSVDTLLQRGIHVQYEQLAGLTHFNVPGYVSALSQAVPWLLRQWEES